MSHLITISEETFAKLQALAKPFTDTPESVIALLADTELQRRRGSGTPENGKGPSSELLRLDPDAHDNLTHSRLLSASVGGSPLHRPKWNGLMHHLHLMALRRLGSFDALRQKSGANLRQGRFEESGYRYLPEADLSIQGVDANLAWDHSLKLARELEVPIRAKLEWRNKPGAAHAGKQAVLEWNPVEA